MMADDGCPRERIAELERLIAARATWDGPADIEQVEEFQEELDRLRNEQPSMIDRVRAARDDRHGRELVAALRDHNAAVVNLRDSAADEIERLLPSPAASPPQDVRALLREARQYVADAGSDEELTTSELQLHKIGLLEEIDAALATVRTHG